MIKATLQQIDVRNIQTLQKMVSEEFSDWSDSLIITQEMVNQFADLTGDLQWIHVDVERARKESPFGASVVHGFLLLSLMPSLRPPLPYTLSGYSSAANYGSGGLRFLKPVLAGASVYARQRLKRVEAHRRGTLLTSEVAFHEVGHNKPALVYDLQVLYNYARAG